MILRWELIMLIAFGILVGGLLLLGLYDVFQTKHAVLRNFPVLGHARYLIEMLGPELRQYIVAANDEERPFSRDERSWIYASSKRQNNYFGFGSDNDMERSPNYMIVKHSVFPITSPHAGEDSYDPLYRIPCAKVVGGFRERKHAFRPASAVNVSGMSYGSLSAAAVEALNRGCATAECLQSTGEGAIAPHHDHGARLVWQLGTGYFGCRATDGGFSMPKLLETMEKYDKVAAIEVKLSQGAKPGKGGILPAAKITPEIADIRGIPMGEDCLSPASHREFSNADGLLDFVERLADETGRPVGIKSAVGDFSFWKELADLMEAGDRAVDFITIDGGEGGTGAGPLVFTDHVAFPFKQAFARVYKLFHERGLHERIVFAGSGMLGLPHHAVFAFALGCDMINVGRGAMLAIGCIQAQKCHTNHCPTGVATQNAWLMRGLDRKNKADRVANYIVTLRKELLSLSHACGVAHPALITPERIEICDDRYSANSLTQLFGYDADFGLPSAGDQQTVLQLMKGRGD
jgi:glutamate synthase (ferredoxin)